MNIHVIREVLELSSRCDRVLSSPGGSLLLAGRSGVGRRSAVSIISALQQAKMVRLKMGKNFGLKQFKTELKNAMQCAGVEDEQVFLLVEDHNLIDFQFLDMVNSLLSSGEVPGLYTPEEFEPLMIPLRQKASNSGYSGDLFSFYAKSVKKNLHIILIMDCTSDTFTINCESNPALYKECSVQWNENWCEESFLKLPMMIMLGENEAEIGEKSKKEKEKLSRMVSVDDKRAQSFYLIHSTMNPKTTTPRKFVRFVNTYLSAFCLFLEQCQNFCFE